ncbi:MAG: nucleotide exchange factor GrpE [Patescibacteria group bacterium]
MSKKPTLADLQQQIGELTDALQRERADAINVRRRTDEDKAKLGDFYKVMILRELLPAIDNLERALMHVPKELKDHDYVKGVQGVAKQFEQCFKQLGIERIKTVGEHFDPHFHEAVHMDDTGGEYEVITEELTSGYKLGDEVIRHATVKVKKEK